MEANPNSHVLFLVHMLKKNSKTSSHQGEPHNGYSCFLEVLVTNSEVRKGERPTNICSFMQIILLLLGHDKYLSKCLISPTSSEAFEYLSSILNPELENNLTTECLRKIEEKKRQSQGFSNKYTFYINVDGPKIIEIYLPTCLMK